MNYFLRPYRKSSASWKSDFLIVAAVAAAMTPLAFAGDSAMQMVSVMDDPPALMMHSSQGYLGVTIHDIDANRAGELKLKDVRGAEIVMLDHDAPACKAGLKLHDVIVQMNGQTIEGIEQLRRMLHETPVGRTVNLVVSRDGQPMNISVQLGDRAKLEQQPFLNPSDAPDSQEVAPLRPWIPLQDQPETGVGSFIGSFKLNPLYVGVLVDAVGPQLADYFGVKTGTGLLVRSVDEDSPAGAAGMKAGDVILAVNGKTMAGRRDWLQAIQSNRGKQVQVTIIRDHKEQKLTMAAGLAKNKS
jgi:serine protease Do